MVRRKSKFPIVDGQLHLHMISEGCLLLEVCIHFCLSLDFINKIEKKWLMLVLFRINAFKMFRLQLLKGLTIWTLWLDPGFEAFIFWPKCVLFRMEFFQFWFERWAFGWSFFFLVWQVDWTNFVGKHKTLRSKFSLGLLRMGVSTCSTPILSPCVNAYNSDVATLKHCEHVLTI